MGYFEYRDLAPIDNIENGDKYIEALNWAFQNKKVKNIALTGPYGAGKSSVIETFLAQDDKKNNKGFPFRANTIRKKSLKISMATFFKGKALENAESGEKIEVDADEVEKGILKQLFYKVEPGKIPQSRYRKIHKITQELSLSDEQMLAMIIFKNIHPSDFADIQSESGVIKQAFEDKQRFISAKKQEMQAEIDDYETAVERYQADSMKSVREIKYAMFGELMGRLGTPESIRKRYYETISADKIMQDNFDLAQLLSEKYDEIHYYYGSGYSNQTSINKEMLESYIERWKEINRVRKIGLQEMQEKLQQLRMQQHDLSGLSIAKLLEEYLPEEVLSETVRRNKLLVFLLRRAYIDEKYASYINYFKGTSITKDDMNFILSVKNQEPLAFDYQLTKVPMVIQRLQEYEFEEKAIYNFTLLEELLSEGESVKLSAFINQLSDEEETSWRFIDEFFSYTKQREQFIQLLTEKWTGMWTHISADATMTYDHKLEYLCEIMNTSPISVIEELNADGSMTAFFEQHEDILQKLEPCENEKIISVIQCLNVHFTRLLIENVANNILDAVFDGDFFVLNQEMIQTIVWYKKSSMVGDLTTRPYSTLIALKYLPLLQYVQDNIELYVREVVLTNEVLKDNAEDIIDLLRRLDGVTEVQLQIVRQEQFALSNIEDCAGDLVRENKEKWNAVWDELLIENIIEPNWNNIIQYWKIYSFTDTLKEYVSTQVDVLKEADTAAVSDEFIKEFINSEFSGEIQRKLIPVLKMDDFDMDVSTIDPSTLQIMIDCRYFAFSAERYESLAAISPNFGVDFITQNQDDFMAVKNSITMSGDLFESLMLSEHIQKEYKDELFTEYAESCMTAGVAMKMAALKLPVTKDIADAAMDCVGQQDKSEILFANIGVYGAGELPRKFNELGGIYANLADRTKRHESLLAGLESNIKEDRTDLDLLFGCLLDWGLPLSMPYSSEQIDGCTVHTYNDGDLIACFDKNVPESVVKEIAKRQPLRAVFRDSSFVNSPAKINVTEIFKLIAPDTRVKVI